jgi:DNA-binding NarL/FixJ family response regulator
VKVLIAEDYSVSRTVLKRTVEIKESLQTRRVNTPDVVISDWMMPNHDRKGYTFSSNSHEQDGVQEMSETQDSRTARIVLADDQSLIRIGLRSILAQEPDIEIVGEASTGAEALQLCRLLKPDLVLMDIQMPEMDGLVATREIKEELPLTSVLVLTAHDNIDYLLEAVRAGAAGYLLKESASQRVAGAIRRVIDGESPLDQELAMRLLGQLSAQTVPTVTKEVRRAEKLRREALEVLTDRELEILSLLARGLTNQQISENLYLSVGTVKTHVHRIISKLGVSDRTQAAVLAIRLGLTSTEDH